MDGSTTAVAGSRCVGKVISSVSDFVPVCVYPRSKRKRLELSTPNLAHMWQHIGIRRPRGDRRSKSQSYEVRRGMSMYVDTTA